jgi:phospholipid transport system substrate-binding protein
VIITMEKINFLSIFTIVVFFLAALPVMANRAGPTEQLQPTIGKLVNLLNDTSLEGDAYKKVRREKIMATIAESFDFSEMSKRILSRTWKKINDDEKIYFTQLMTKLLENNYIGQLEGYSGQTVKFVGERIKGEKAQVSTLVMSRGVKYPVHYIMMIDKEKDRWMVYDINIEGVSLVRNYRAEFKSIVRKEKYEGLVKVLEEKNKSFE